MVLLVGFPPIITFLKWVTRGSVSLFLKLLNIFVFFLHYFLFFVFLLAPIKNKRKKRKGKRKRKSENWGEGVQIQDPEQTNTKYFPPSLSFKNFIQSFRTKDKIREQHDLISGIPLSRIPPQFPSSHTRFLHSLRVSQPFPNSTEITFLSWTHFLLHSRLGEESKFRIFRFSVSSPFECQCAGKLNSLAGFFPFLFL